MTTVAVNREGIAADNIRLYLSYNADTGVFTWTKSPSNCVTAGNVAGVRRKDGYVKINFKNKAYLAHRLAWWYVHGEFPTDILDHIDRDKSNNKITNLRVSSKIKNAQNINVNNTRAVSGLAGAFKARTAWSSKLKIGDTLIRLGTFKTPEDAHKAYMKAKQELHKDYTP